MKPIHNNYTTAETFTFAKGITMRLLLSGADTNGVQEVFEDIVDPNIGPGRHVHHKQDETFLFLEGTFDVEIDGRLFRMKAGDTAFIPKGAVHAWKNVGEGVGRLRYIFSPALTMEAMFRELNNAAQNERISEEVMKEVALKYPEQENMGPPL